MQHLNISCPCFSFSTCRSVRLRSLLVFYTISPKSAHAPLLLLSANSAIYPFTQSTFRRHFCLACPQIPKKQKIFAHIWDIITFLSFTAELRHYIYKLNSALELTELHATVFSHIGKNKTICWIRVLLCDTGICSQAVPGLLHSCHGNKSPRLTRSSTFWRFA